MKENTPKCEWFDVPCYDEPGTGTEHCTSGKPAIFQHCGFRNTPVCEDHKCRCPQLSGQTHEITQAQKRIRNAR